VNASAGDYRLLSCSPAINTGLPDNLPAEFTVDLAGKPRIKGIRIDLGAYEFQDAPDITPNGNGVVYVKKSCFDIAKNGSSWETAYPNFSDVLLETQTNSAIREIWVAEGVYMPRHIRVSDGTFRHRDRAFVIANNVKIYGSFPANGNPGINDRDTKKYPTVLSGNIGDVNNSTDNSCHVVLGLGTLTNAAVLDGFIVTGGYSTSSDNSTIAVNGVSVNRRQGGGISLWNGASLKLDSLTVFGNTAYNGGGFYSDNSSPSLTHSSIYDNTAAYNGGGFLNSNGTPTFDSVQIYDNMATNYGGGFLNNGNSDFKHVVINGNTAASGGGFYNNNGTPTFDSVQISDNTATGNGGGFFNNNDNSVFKHVFIDGNKAASGGGFYNSSGTPTFDSVRISDNTATNYGGGFYNNNDNSVFKHVFIEGNKATSGGGFYNSSGTPTFDSVQISDNKATNYGGGFYNNSNSVFNHVFIDGNTAANGGGFFNSNGSPTFDSVQISDNKATGNGGGFYNNGNSVFNHVFIDGNKAASGGGFYNAGGAPALSNVQFVKDTATANGGGFYNNANATMTWDNILFADNAAGNYGGGLYSDNGTLTLNNGAIAGNKANNGGGVYRNGGTLNLRNSIIWGNTAPSNPNVYGTVSYSYTLLQGGTVSGTSVISVNDPLFVVDGYSLSLVSPAINKGNDSYNTTTTDLVGNPRFYGTIDLGPYEFQSVPLVTVNDTALTRVADSVVIDVLANDYLAPCENFQLDTVVGSGAKHGTVKIVAADSTLVYTPDAGHFGIDSLDYTIGCDGNISSPARVYILTLNPLSKEYRDCPGMLTTMYFVKIPDVGYDWYDAAGTTVIEPSSDTLRRTATTATQTFFAQPLWRDMPFPFDTVRLHPAEDKTPQAIDIRLTLCPSPVRHVYLTAYLDSLPYASAVQWTTTGVYPAILDAATGYVNTADFHARGTFTYSYTRHSECNTTSSNGKAYVHVVNGKIPSRRDTIVICRDQAAAINVSSIFGLEFDSDFSAFTDDAITDNVTTTSVGALIFNGDKAYNETAASTVIYRGITGKPFVFEYDYSASNCVTGKKKIVIVVY
jgi:hypothetical protein